MCPKAADLERDVARALGGKRVLRQDLFESAFDVEIPDFPSFRVDAKYRKRFSHHSIMREIRRKYDGLPVLVTRSGDGRDTFATVPLKLLARLLEIARASGVTELESAGPQGGGHQPRPGGTESCS